MNIRLFAGSVLVLSVMPVGVTAQSLAGSDPHPEVHTYAAEDFDIDPNGVTYTKDIAPILRRSVAHHIPGGQTVGAVDSTAHLHSGPDGRYAALLCREGLRDSRIQG